MTIGDIMAVIAIIFAVGATWAATLLLVALAFPARVARAQQQVISAPGVCLARGFVIFVVVALVAAALGRHHAGPVRLISGVLYAAMGVLAAIGSAGIARIIGERIQAAGTAMTPFSALTRGTILYVLSGYLPVIGWLFVAPVALLISLGSAVVVLRAAPVESPLPTPRQPAQASEAAA